DSGLRRASTRSDSRCPGPRLREPDEARRLQAGLHRELLEGPARPLRASDPPRGDQRRAVQEAADLARGEAPARALDRGAARVARGIRRSRRLLVVPRERALARTGEDREGFREAAPFRWRAEVRLRGRRCLLRAIPRIEELVHPGSGNGAEEERLTRPSLG